MQQGNQQLIYPIQNIHESDHAFMMHPQELINVLLEIEEKGADPVLIYHSHPLGKAVPSSTDLAENSFPDMTHLIWGIENNSWHCRAYRFERTTFQEIELIVE